MMQEFSAERLINAFDPIDRDALEIPQLAGVEWGERDYFAWKDKGGHRTYLVTQLPERDVGIVFRTESSGRGGFCDLCMSADHRMGVVLATADSWEKPRRSHGIFVCANFDCSAAARGQRAADNFGETISRGRRIERLQLNLEGFVRSLTGLTKKT
jgi:hypothetical protein